MLKRLSKPTIWLLALLLVILVSSLFASLVQNSFFSVKVDKISFETERGEISGYLYVPKGVDSSNPAPAVLLTHGYLNNAEMQEIGAIELSRRGFVVLAFDMYDHGDSTWDTPAAFSFFPFAVYDAVQYMYDQPYVLKAANGDGMIGVSGHSMGGFSSSYAVLLDEGDFAINNGYRKIVAALPQGSDFRYVGAADQSFFGPRSAGIIAAHWDQFFFDNVTPGTSGSVRYKDFTKDPVGLSFLGRTTEGTAEAGVWYDLSGGQRVIYTPDETHPQNTWSLETGSNIIEFFTEAFDYQLAQHSLGSLASNGIDSEKTGQVWWLKEAFTMIALVALFALIFPAFALLTKLPIFNKVFAKNEEAETTMVVEKSSSNQMVLKVMIIILATLLGAFYLNIFLDRQDAGMTLLAKTMHYIIGGSFVFIIGAWLISVFKPGEEGAKFAQKVTLGAGIVIFVALTFRWLLMNPTIITNTNYWSAPSINSISYWSMAAGGLLLLTTFGTAPLFNAGKEVHNPYGLKASWVQVLTSLLTALVLVFGLFLLIAVVEWVFLTDFRFYTYAIKVFNSPQFVAALRYMPLFLVYYFAAGVAVFANTHQMKGWKADILAAFLLVGPVLLFLVYQYFVLYNTGVAPFPGFSLNAILLVGLVPTLSVAGIIIRRFSEKTGNIWTSVFFTSAFFTFVALANTAVYLINFK
ncbi:MAG: alpha/beta fold hydrolase [Acholeplasmataceae bacterium]|nr:alpha/beta fold hydrolase [Acholeplasmataceae bacterium]MDD4194531.1 alpha/beta fold hydrolase [Acholeplasmataceae bacterium]